MGPLSGKQHREYLKFQNKEAREAAKMELDEKRKQQLHEIKLQEAAAKANQGLGHKEKVNNAKLKEMGIPLPKGASINKQKLGIPSTNPIAGTGMFKQGQHKLAEGTNGVQGTTDTVPAMLTPGEAVIPAPAAQDPKNKKAIQRMVEEGRRANALRDGAVDVRYSDAPGQAKYHEMGTTQVVPSLAYEHSDVPGSSFNDGTEHVFSRGSADMQHYSNGTYGVVPQQVQSAAGYENGTEEVSNVDRFLNWVAGQKPTQTKVVSAPLTTEKPPTVSKDDFFKMVSIAEAGGDPYAAQKQKDQTAAGLTGTTVGTLKLYQKTNPELRGVEHKSEAYFKPEFQRKLSDAQYDDRVKQLNRKGLPVTMENLYAAGFGPRGISAIAAPNEDKLVNHFNNEEIKNNKYFGNTAGDFKNFISKKVTEAGKSLGQVATNMIPSAQASTLPTAEVPTVAPVSQVPKPVNDSLFNQDQKDLIRLSELVNDNTLSANDKKWAYTEIDRIKRNNPLEIPKPQSTSTTNVDPMGNVISVDQSQVVDYPKTSVNTYPTNVDAMGNVIAGNESNLEVPPAPVKTTTTEEVPYTMQGEGIKTTLDKDRFNKLGQFSGGVSDQLAETLDKVNAMPVPEKEKEGILSRMISGIFGESGLFGDKELLRFSLLAAGGMLTGGSVGGSLRYAGLNTLQYADRMQTEKRAEDKQLESEMVKEGRDAVAVREWIKGNKKGEPPAIRTSAIRNGKSQLMTMTAPTKIGDKVFKPGDPVWVYEVVQQYGNRKGETVQMARIGNKDVPFDSLMAQGAFLDSWDSGKYGNIAKLKRAQDFSEKLAKDKFEPIIEKYFGASNVKGKANPERKGLVTAGMVASQVESFYRNKVDLDDRPTQNEIEKITGIAAEQLVKDIESGTFKNSSDITPYLASAEFREKGKLSDKLVTLDKKSGRIMSADDILALRDSADTFISKNKLKTSPDAEIARLAEVWNSNSNGIQNKYKNSDRNTAFALFVLDTFKK